MKYCHIFVEGQQDVLFLGRILQEMGQTDVTDVEAIPERWSPFVNSERLREHRGKVDSGRSGLRIHEMFPGVCFLSETHSIIIRKVGGNLKNFRRTMDGVDALLDGGLAGLDAIGVVPDADDRAANILQSSKTTLENFRFNVAADNGEIHTGTPNTGIFVLPGATDNGGLEELLIDCAEAVYPDLLTGAREFVDAVDRESDAFTPKDMKELGTPQGAVKAVVGCVSSILKPGSTIQVSILKDRWVSEQSLASPRVGALRTFLKDLCELP